MEWIKFTQHTPPPADEYNSVEVLIFADADKEFDYEEYICIATWNYKWKQWEMSGITPDNYRVKYWMHLPTSPYDNNNNKYKLMTTLQDSINNIKKIADSLPLDQISEEIKGCENLLNCLPVDETSLLIFTEEDDSKAFFDCYLIYKKCPSAKRKRLFVSFKDRCIPLIEATCPIKVKSHPFLSKFINHCADELIKLAAHYKGQK